MQIVPKTDDRIGLVNVVHWKTAVYASVAIFLHSIIPLQQDAIWAGDDSNPATKQSKNKVAEPRKDDRSPDTLDDDKQTNEGTSVSGIIVDDAGAPVADAELTLTLQEGGGQKVILSAATDKDGKYQFDEVPRDGDYLLAIKSARCFGRDQSKDWMVISLSSKLPVIRNVRLPRECRIKIRVITEEESEPIANARIYYVLSTDSRPRYNQNFVTDNDGWVEIACPKADGTKYLFGAMHDAFAMEQITQELDDPERVPRRTILMRKGKTIVGRAVCSDGDPPSGWHISATPSWWNFGVYPSGTVIDNEGSFRLEHVVPGKYNVTISVPMGRKSSSTPKRVLVDTDLIEKGEPLQVKLDYPSPSSLVYIKGRVKIEGDFAKTDGFWIHARSTTGNYSTSEFVRGDDAGFSLGPTPKGVYRLDISHPKLEPAPQKDVEAPAEDMTIELRTRRKIMLRGTVTDLKTGKPIDAFSVRAIRTRSLDQTTYQQDDRWKNVSDPQGAFELEMNGHGVYQVKVIASGFGPTTIELINTMEQPDRVLSLGLKPGITLNGLIVNEQGEPISGAMVTALSMIARDTPSANDDSTFPVASVNSFDGRFTFENMAEGRETLRVVHPDYCSTVVKDTEVKPGSVDPVRITLTPGATVRGYVYDENGAPMANAAIHFHHGPGYEFAHRPENQIANVVTDKNGYYQVHHLPSQLIYITRSPSGDTNGVVRRSLYAENRKTHSIDMGGHSQLTGRITLNGEPLADKRIQFGSDHPWIGIMQSYTQTSADGSFKFRGAVPGKWKLYVQRAPNDWIRLSELIVPANGAGELGTINLQTGRVTVTLDPLTEEMANSVSMQLTDFDPIRPTRIPIAQPNHRKTLTDPFIFDSVPAGDYVISCFWHKHLQTEQRLTVTPDNLTSNVSIKLPVGTAAITGSVAQELCRRDGTQTLRLWSADLRFFGQISPKLDGTFKLENLPAGDYGIRREATRTAPVIYSLKLGDGENKQLELTCENTQKSVLSFGFLSVKVRHGDGIPLPCEVEVTGTEGRLKPNSVQEGRSIFVGPPGKYEVVVNFPGFMPVTRQVEMQLVNPDSELNPSYEVIIDLKSEDK